MVGFHWRECEIISHNSRNILGKCPNQHIIGTPTVIVGTLGAEAVTPWREEVGLLDPEHKHMLAKCIEQRMRAWHYPETVDAEIKISWIIESTSISVFGIKIVSYGSGDSKEVCQVLAV